MTVWQIEPTSQIHFNSSSTINNQVLPILLHQKTSTIPFYANSTTPTSNLLFLFGIPWQQILWDSSTFSNLFPIQSATTPPLSVVHKEAPLTRQESILNNATVALPTTTTTTTTTTSSITWWKPLYILLQQWNQMVWKQVIEQFETEFDIKIKKEEKDSSIAIQNIQQITLNYLIQECNIEQLLQPKHKNKTTTTPLESLYYYQVATSNSTTTTSSQPFFNNSYIELLNAKQLETLIKIQCNIQKQFHVQGLITWEQFYYLQQKKKQYTSSILSLPNYVLQIVNHKMLYFYMQWLRSLFPRYLIPNTNAVAHSFWLGIWMIPECYMNWQVEPLRKKEQIIVKQDMDVPILEQQVQQQAIPTLKWTPPNNVPLIQPLPAQVPSAVAQSTNTNTSPLSLSLPQFSTFTPSLQQRQSPQQSTNKTQTNRLMVPSINSNAPIAKVPIRSPTQQTRIQPQYNQDLLKQLEKRLF